MELRRCGLCLACATSKDNNFPNFKYNEELGIITHEK